MSTESIEYLLEQYLADRATEEEKAALKKIMSEPENASIVTASLEQFIEKSTNPEWKAERLDEMVKQVLDTDRLVNSEWSIVNGEEERMLLRSERNDDDKVSRAIFPWMRVAAAASIILAIGIGSYFIFFNKGTLRQAQVDKEVAITNDVTAPTTTKAMITLADGRNVTVDSIANGTLVVQNNVNVIKTADGQIVYNGSSAVIEYNIFTNPRGSKVQPLTLSDGTKVWLNSESSIRFPTAFAGSERNVEITGEAYFEVTKNPTKKFIVTSNGVTTEVLGTHFNVNTYTDESSINVTLLEGSVKITKGSSTSLLKPGQQGQVNEVVKVLSNADIEQVMAWKNGDFKFSRTDLKIIMREIGRWYDVEVSYEGNIPVQLYNIGVPRTANVSEVLKGLEFTGAHFSVEGKKIIVRP